MHRFRTRQSSKFWFDDTVWVSVERNGEWESIGWMFDNDGGIRPWFVEGLGIVHLGAFDTRRKAAAAMVKVWEERKP